MAKYLVQTKVHAVLYVTVKVSARDEGAARDKGDAAASKLLKAVLRSNSAITCDHTDTASAGFHVNAVEVEEVQS